MGEHKNSCKIFLLVVSPVVKSTLEALIIVQANCSQRHVPGVTFKGFLKESYFKCISPSYSFLSPNLGFSYHLPILLPSLAWTCFKSLSSAMRAVTGGHRHAPHSQRYVPHLFICHPFSKLFSPTVQLHPSWILSHNPSPYQLLQCAPWDMWPPACSVAMSQRSSAVNFIWQQSGRSASTHSCFLQVLSGPPTCTHLLRLIFIAELWTLTRHLCTDPGLG